MTNAKDDPGLYFRDGLRRIDIVLAYEDDPAAAATAVDDGLGDTFESQSHKQHKQQSRATFEENLRVAGMELELEHKENSFDRKTYFLKIHAPKNVLERNAEVMGMKKPIKEFIVTYYTNKDSKANQSQSSSAWWMDREKGKSTFACKTITQEPNIFFPGFLPEVLDKYVLKERSDDLTSIQRTQIVWQVLSRVRYDNSNREAAGIGRLITKKVYKAAFPLHEGEIDYGSTQQNEEWMNERRILYLEWASLKNFYRKQPLWLIKKYLGVKIGLYFAWMGFYTQSLIIPSVVGILCFLFGISTISSPLNQSSRDICDDELMGNTTMCPLCDHFCTFWKLRDSCILSKITYIFDNAATVFFAIFMSVWATTYLELWKRRQAILQWEWDLNSEEEKDEIRPEFELQVKTTRLNPITQRKEPYVAAKEMVLRISLTYGIVIFMLAAVMGAVFSILLFRLVLINFMYDQTRSNFKISQFAKIIATLLAASINAAAIEVAGFLFQIVATKITSIELPRTQADFENSYTFKMFLFQFINYYSSLVYTAFFKGRFFTDPGDAGSRNGIVSRLKTDMCDPAGCLYELCFTLSVFMIVRQLVSNSVELYIPKFKNWLRKLVYFYNTRSIWVTTAIDGRERISRPSLKRWEADYQLSGLKRLHLFDEYIEVVIQYGFVTLFVAAFPLAPLLALVNNVFEIRLDAYKYITLLRRPIGSQCQDIGVWYGILSGMTYLSVVFNAFIIALTSDFIPKMVYLFVNSGNYSLEVYNTSDWGDPHSLSGTYFGPKLEENITRQPFQTCRYLAYRTPPDDPHPYEITKNWLHVFAARLAFVVVFEHLVFLINSLLSYAIPNVPSNLRTQFLRERQLQRELEFQQERWHHHHHMHQHQPDGGGVSGEQAVDCESEDEDGRQEGEDALDSRNLDNPYMGTHSIVAGAFAAGTASSLVEAIRMRSAMKKQSGAASSPGT